MKKLLTLISLLFISVGSFALTPILGSLSGCIGATTYLDDTTGGGTWTSSNTSVATVGSVSGMVTPIAMGATTITYTLGGSYVTAVYVVAGTAPAAITGTTSLCLGTSSTLTDATSGGVWSSHSTSVATISGGGVVTPAHSGTTIILYTVGACSASADVTVGYTVIDSVTGPTTVCTGTSMTLSCLTTGGAWSSGNTAIATVGATTGIVTGVTAGRVIIDYTVTGCGGASYTAYLITVNSATVTGTISGATSDYVGATTTLSESSGGGTWGSSNTSVATIDASTGVVTGVANGAATISYGVTGCTGLAYATSPMTVTTSNIISGNVMFSAGWDTLTGATLKVWLITLNTTTHMLEASDSITTVFSGPVASYAYQFLGEGTDSYRVKAAVHPLGYTVFGYIPTYHTSSRFWSSANVFYHTGLADEGMDIDMAFGPDTTTGPGFISGDVTTGANRGTSGSVPAAGLLMIAESSAGTVVQQTYTDASGNYSFSNLPLATYTIHPELINYTSIDYTSVTLTSAVPAMSAANFIQHTVSHTITPSGTGVVAVKPTVATLITYPNPTTGKLKIAWQETTNEKGNVSITDITGREIYKTTINMTEGSGLNQIDLSGFANGLYIISVKSGDINYINKIQVQH